MSVTQSLVPPLHLKVRIKICLVQFSYLFLRGTVPRSAASIELFEDSFLLWVRHVRTPICLGTGLSQFEPFADIVLSSTISSASSMNCIPSFRAGVTAKFLFFNAMKKQLCAILTSNFRARRGNVLCRSSATCLFLNISQWSLISEGR